MTARFVDRMWELLKSITADAEREFGSIQALRKAVYEQGKTERRRLATRLATRLLTLNKWGNSARVVVTTDATTQALLACTPTGPICHEDLVTPFGYMAIQLDPPIGKKSGGVRWIICGVVQSPREDEDSWVSYVAGYDNGGIESFGEYSDIVTGCLTSMTDIPDDMPDFMAFRVAVGLSRLIKSHTSAPHNTVHEKQVEIKDSGPSKKTGTNTVKVRRLFIVEPRVAEACRAAMRGNHKAPSVKFLVRGHWRNQACGKEHKERNLMWIQPHWKGAMKDVLRPVEVRVL